MENFPLNKALNLCCTLPKDTTKKYKMHNQKYQKQREENVDVKGKK